jgi:hypothetical protein
VFWSWLIIAIVLLAIGSYVLGTLDLDYDEAVGVFWAIFFGSLLWPAVLLAVMIVGPFYGLYWLGYRKREKAFEAAAKDK